MKSTKMIQGEGATWYLTILSWVKYELASIGVTISKNDMVRITLKAFIEEWKNFIKRIVSRETLRDWYRMWDDFIQEEL